MGYFFIYFSPHNFVYIDERMARVSCNSSHAALYESSQEVGHTLEMKLPKKLGTINFCCCLFVVFLTEVCVERIYIYLGTCSRL